MTNKQIKIFCLSIIMLLGALSLKAQNGDDGYEIKVTIDNFKDTAAYLGYHFGDQKFVKDTSLVKNGNQLIFEGEETLKPGIYFVYSPSAYFELIINDQHFSVKTDTTDFVGNMVIEGSEENKIFNTFQKHMAEKQQESRRLGEELNSLNQGTDDDKINEIRSRLAEIAEEIDSYQDKVIADNSGTFVSTLIQAMQKPEVPDPPTDENGEVIDKNFRFFYYKNHFFDHFDLADPGLLRTPLYQPKVDEYLEKLTYQHPDSINKAADFLLSKAEPNEETFRYMLVKLTNKYETSNIMGMERVFVHLAENYYLKGKAFWADEDLVSKFEKRVKELKPNLVGNIAPDMVLRDTSLKPVKLSELDDRFIILYFYDPDCGHCKKTTPKLKELYSSLKEKDVEVMAACTITDIDKWKKYVSENELPFLNVADPYYQSNFRADYDIKSTPMIYVLDKNKEIIAKKLGVEQLEGFIDRMIEFEEKNKS